jgi:7-carboxy-7-deazaguanine synthase
VAIPTNTITHPTTVTPMDARTPTIYRVNEIYSGLEGEGSRPGIPTVRVRLQGCSQPCKLRKLCDQQSALGLETDLLLDAEAIVARVMAMDADLPYPYLWTAISGGEPLEQWIEPLVRRLQESGKLVRVETSGMPRRLEIPVEYLRVSPKERSPERTLQDWGEELSVVYTGMEDLESWERWGRFNCRTLQPLWRPDGSSNIEEVFRICLARPIWQASIQLHKYAGLL